MKNLIFSLCLSAAMLLQSSALPEVPGLWEVAYAAPAALGSYAPGVRIPSAPGDVVYSSSSAEIDASNVSSGYVMVAYTGSVSKVKLRVTTPGGTTYTYTLNGESGYQALPLTGGNGSYKIEVFEHVSGNQYANALTKTIPVKLSDPFLPYLYSNRYVSFGSSTAVVQTADALAAGCGDELALVEAVYNYTLGAVDYDYDMAQAVLNGSVAAGYTPALNSIISKGKGICFDYAAVMTAMLRAEGIPTRLEIGYAGKIYHAWISVYTREKGWVNGVIQFNGNAWTLMDPTNADAGGESVLSFITNPANYRTIYVY